MPYYYNIQSVRLSVLDEDEDEDGDEDEDEVFHH